MNARRAGRRPQERARLHGKRIGVVWSGGNVDPEVFAEALRAPESAR